MSARRSAASRLLAALLTGIAGFIAFNVVDGVFGFGLAIFGLVACTAITVFVVWRSQAAEEEPDA